MPWTWRYEKADGAVVSGAGLQEAIFASQGDAESWLGENWRDLLDSGVDQVYALRRQPQGVRPDVLAPGKLTRSGWPEDERGPRPQRAPAATVPRLCETPGAAVTGAP